MVLFLEQMEMAHPQLIAEVEEEVFIHLAALIYIMVHQEVQDFNKVVQVVDAPEFTLVGLQARAETSMGAARLKVVLWEARFRVAVMVADWVVVIVPTVAVKVVEVLLAGTVTDAGTVSAVLLLESATALPPEGAD